MSTTTNGTNPVKMKSSFKLWVFMDSLMGHDELSENFKKRKSTLHLVREVLLHFCLGFIYVHGCWVIQSAVLRVQPSPKATAKRFSSRSSRNLLQHDQHNDSKGSEKLFTWNSVWLSGWGEERCWLFLYFLPARARLAQMSDLSVSVPRIISSTVL